MCENRLRYGAGVGYNIAMKSYDVILLDLDGTLVDSKPGIFHCIRYALDAKGIACPQETMDKMIGPPFRVSMREFLGLEMPLIEELITLYRGLYETDGWRECEVYPQVFDMLKALRAANKRLAVATSKPMKFTSLMVEGLGLSPYFEFVGGASSDLSREAKKDIIEMCLANMRVEDKSKVLMVGDRLYDIVGAREAGVDVAGEMWGYGTADEMREYKPDYVFSTPSELAKAIVEAK